MSDTRYREPWAVPDCPRCQSPVFVERSQDTSHERDWICHSCEHEFYGGYQ